MRNTSVELFLVKFKNEIAFHEIELFRGAVLNALGPEGKVLYHNHTGDTTFRYSYPLVQYKRIRKKASIFCVGEGVEAIGQYLSSQKFSLMLGNRPVHLEIEAVSPKRNLVQVWDSVFRYRIQSWLPLNSENYRLYMELDECMARIAFLEKILIGNLLSFAKGMGIRLDMEIICKILSIKEPRLVRVKGVKMMAFDGEFKTNLSLPDYIGIGKHVSIGFGTVVRVYDENNDKKYKNGIS